MEDVGTKSSLPLLALSRYHPPQRHRVIKRGMNLQFRDPEAASLYLRNKPCPPSERLALAEHGFSLRYSEPAAGRAWCDAALIGLPSETDVHTAALLHGYAGNAHRIMGEFTSAEHLLKKALALNSADPLLLEFWASLLKDRLRLKEASEALSLAATLRRQKEDPIPHASTLLQTAIVLDLAAKPDEAASVALGSIKEIGDHSPSQKGEELLRSALQNLALYLTDAGRPTEALWVLRHSRPLLAQGGFRFELRMEWLLARIAGALGEESAREAFVVVRERFVAEEMLEEVALVSLDLARHLSTSSPLEAQAEVRFVGPILSQLGIAEDSEEVRLLHSILDSAPPDVDLLSKLSRALYSRPRVRTY